MTSLKKAQIIDKDICYIYPMANSLRGGAIASEYNIRNLFNVLLSKSSAKQFGDFDFDHDISGDWYTKSSTSTNTDLLIDFNINIGKGSGNCNGYYVEVSDEISNFNFSRTFTIDTDESNWSKNIFNLYVYLRIIYSGTGISDGAFLWVGSEDDVSNELTVYEKYGFYDIGILLGTVTVDATKYLSKSGSDIIHDLDSVTINYAYNENIMNCIDIDRLGNANGSFVSQLYNKLSRLYRLMLDSGFITIGAPENNIPPNPIFNPDPTVTEITDETNPTLHDFNLIAPNRIQLYINPPNINEGQDYYTGGLRYCRYDESAGEFINTDEYPKDLIVFTSSNSSNGYSEIESIKILNNNFIFDNDHFIATNIDVNNIRVIDSTANNRGVLITASYSDNNLLTFILSGYSGNESKNVTLVCDSINTSGDITSVGTITGNRVIGAIWQ